jgi:hypothetical protein
VLTFGVVVAALVKIEDSILALKIWHRLVKLGESSFVFFPPTISQTGAERLVSRTTSLFSHRDLVTFIR